MNRAEEILNEIALPFRHMGTVGVSAPKLATYLASLEARVEQMEGCHVCGLELSPPKEPASWEESLVSIVVAQNNDRWDVINDLKAFIVEEKKRSYKNGIKDCLNTIHENKLLKDL